MATGSSIFVDESFQERVFVTITKKGGSDVDFHSSLNEIGFGGGEKGTEGQPLMNGGRRRIHSAQEDFEFTGTLYQYGVDASSASGLDSWYHASGDNLDGTTGTSEYETALDRTDVRVAVMWTNDDSVTSATDEVSASEDHQAVRYVLTDANITEYVPSFDDQVLTADFTATVTPFDETGSSRLKVQEYTGDASNTLSALSSY